MLIQALITYVVCELNKIQDLVSENLIKYSHSLTSFPYNSITPFWKESKFLRSRILLFCKRACFSFMMWNNKADTMLGNTRWQSANLMGQIEFLQV